MRTPWKTIEKRDDIDDTLELPWCNRWCRRCRSGRSRAGNHKSLSLLFSSSDGHSAAASSSSQWLSPAVKQIWDNWVSHCWAVIAQLRQRPKGPRLYVFAAPAAFFDDDEYSEDSAANETLISSSMPALISIPLTIRFVKSPFWVEFSRVFPFSGLLFQFSKFFSSLFFQELILLLLSHLVYEPAKNQLPIANADPLSRSDRFLIAWKSWVYSCMTNVTWNWAVNLFAEVLRASMEYSFK